MANNLTCNIFEFKSLRGVVNKTGETAPHTLSNHKQKKNITLVLFDIRTNIPLTIYVCLGSIRLYDWLYDQREYSYDRIASSNIDRNYVRLFVWCFEVNTNQKFIYVIYSYIESEKIFFVYFSSSFSHKILNQIVFSFPFSLH